MTNVENLILQFNKDPENRYLQNYYCRKSMMEINGVTRNELSHSAFLAWLLKGDNLNVQQSDTPLMWLLQVLVLRESTRKSTETVIPAHIKAQILTRSLQVIIDEVSTEKPVAEVSGDYFAQKFAGQQPTDDKLDIYIRCKYLDSDAVKTMEIFIENKVLSPEEGPKSTVKLQGYDDKCQTERYYLATAHSKSDLKLHVYLKPDHLDENSDATCTSNEYIQISYQDLLDYILAPLAQNEDLSESARFMINEYIDSLSVPTLDTKATKRIVLATTQKEANDIHNFVSRNDVLLYLVLSALVKRCNSGVASLSNDEKLLVAFAESNKNLLYAIANLCQSSVDLDNLFNTVSPNKVSGYLVKHRFEIYNDANFGFEFLKAFAWHCYHDGVRDIAGIVARFKEEWWPTRSINSYYSDSAKHNFVVIDGFPFELYALKYNWNHKRLERLKEHQRLSQAGFGRVVEGKFKEIDHSYFEFEVL